MVTAGLKWPPDVAVQSTSATTIHVIHRPYATPIVKEGCQELSKIDFVDH